MPVVLLRGVKGEEEKGEAGLGEVEMFRWTFIDD